MLCGAVESGTVMVYGTMPTILQISGSALSKLLPPGIKTIYLLSVMISEMRLELIETRNYSLLGVMVT